MRTARKLRILTLVTAIFAVLMLAAPGYSWTGHHRHGHGSYESHGYHSRDRHYGYGYRNGYYRVHRYPHYPSYQYGPSVSLALPSFVPGFSFYIGP